jgi:transcriptional regulator with XRE-family HTH domain
MDDDDAGPVNRTIFDALAIEQTAARIRAHVEKSGLTQAEIARRAGLQRDAFGRYMLGKTRAPSKKLVAIARVFGVRPSELDPDRPDLDAIADADPTPVRAYTLTPGTGGLVRLEFSAEIPIDLAARIIKTLNGEAPGDPEDER